ncbi:MAG: pyridoxal phosphate-dependent aminotransferase [Betaproteobacteria bacterium]
MNSFRIAQRAQRIDPFYVMEVAKAAREIDRQSAAGADPMIYLNIGEPDFTAADLVREAAEKALRDGLTQYTQSLGLPALRERISDWYLRRFGVEVPASRIVVTAGASAALQLACLALIEAGDEILMPDPCYPCNRHFVSSAEGRAVLLPTTAAERFSLSLQSVSRAWGRNTRGILLASPSNPTGTSIEPLELRRLIEFVQARGGICLIDEIYLGLSYDAHFGQSALALPDALGQSVISINSFSKYFSMTGWRLGWLVLPQELVPVVERLAQNLFICPSAVAQHAALACFEPESLAQFEYRREQFKARRDYFLPALERIGLKVPVRPDGAFYAYADASAAISRLGLPGPRADGTGGSWDLAFELIRRARVVVTPGRDFGQADPHRYLRFSTASSMGQLEEAISRLGRLLG